MTEEMKKELHRLKSEIGSLNQRRREIVEMIKEKEKRILEIKWNKYPIGTRIPDSRGRIYEITGYEEYWPRGRLVKKDGTLSKNENSLFRTNLESENGK